MRTRKELKGNIMEYNGLQSNTANKREYKCPRIQRACMRTGYANKESGQGLKTIEFELPPMQQNHKANAVSPKRKRLPWRGDGMRGSKTPQPHQRRMNIVFQPCSHRFESFWIHFVSLGRHVGLTPTDFENETHSHLKSERVPLGSDSHFSFCLCFKGTLKWHFAAPRSFY